MSVYKNWIVVLLGISLIGTGCGPSVPASGSGSVPAEVSSPNAGVSSPNAEVSSPNARGSSSNAEVSSPSAEVSSPNAEVSSPSAEVSSPSAEVSSPSAEVSSSNARVSPPNTESSLVSELQLREASDESAQGPTQERTGAVVEFSILESAGIPGTQIETVPEEAMIAGPVNANLILLHHQPRIDEGYWGYFQLGYDLVRSLFRERGFTYVASSNLDDDGSTLQERASRVCQHLGLGRFARFVTARLEAPIRIAQGPGLPEVIITDPIHSEVGPTVFTLLVCFPESSASRQSRTDH